VTFEEFCNAARCLHECKTARVSINGRDARIAPARPRLVARPAGNSRPAKDSNELTAYFMRVLSKEDTLQIVHAHMHLMDPIAAATACFTLGKLRAEDGSMSMSRAAVQDKSVLQDTRFLELISSVEHLLPKMQSQVCSLGQPLMRKYPKYRRAICKTGSGQLHAWPREARPQILGEAPRPFRFSNLPGCGRL
jgi:hypothetical protein